MKKLISFLIPVYNETDNVENCYLQMKDFSDLHPNYDFEFLFADNHSMDNTLDIIKKLRQEDERVKYISYSKNFGYQHSILQGLEHTKGAAAVILDCDMQDPLEVVSEFIQRWEQGYKVAYGVRIAREESAPMNLLRRIGYRIINKISDEPVPLDAGDFRLVDRVIINKLSNITVYNPYLRSIISRLGFKQIGVPYQRKKRLYGKTKFPPRAMLSLFFNGVFSQSSLPLRLASYLGICMTFVSSIAFITYLILYFFHHQEWPKGYTSVVMLIIFGIGINSLFLGIVGEYINRIYSMLTTISPRAIIEEQDGIE